MPEELELVGPEICPHCGVLSLYRPLAVTPGFPDRTYIFTACLHCGLPIVLLKRGSRQSVEVFTFHENIQPPEFEEEIQKLSPRFCSIYGQAYISEQKNLSELSGLGYRKALEILIKDYLIFRCPQDEEKIKKMQLSSCINSRIDNPRLKATALKSAWLGNDHAHYAPKYHDRDISDLKRFIAATVHWISMELITDEAENLAPTS